MRSLYRFFLYFLFINFCSFGQSSAQPVRILPIGNSITFDFNSADMISPRPDGDRISYRYRLYQLLTAAGYSFDYVGSENAGNNYFQNEEMDDNAGFPNLQDDWLNLLINTGYNEAANQYEAPGPYLLYYPTDIILMEIGTNALDESPADVEDCLNSIRNYDTDVIIMVARIINRHVYSQTTTDFNNNVAAMIVTRNDSRIVTVDLENGAGIDYDLDMFDNLHPDVSGYNKMAAKWFEAINNLNKVPVVTAIPNQVKTQGTSTFSDLALDGYVTDTEDPDNFITWTFTQHYPSKLNFSVNGNRALHATVTDASWYGSDTLTLYATDSGGGAFKKTASTTVVYTVNKANEAPVFTSTPVLTANEDENYSYLVTASDIDGNPLTYSIQKKPDWLIFSSSSHAFSGSPDNNDIGVSEVTVRVSDGSLFADQNFSITVNNVNDVPVITTMPDTVVKAGSSYMYSLFATDDDEDDVLTFSAVFKPDWLSLSAGSNNALLFGIPTDANIGLHAIILKVSDGHADVLQGYTIQVTDPTFLLKDEREKSFSCYYDPASDMLDFTSVQFCTLVFSIFDMTGALKQVVSAGNTSQLQIDISALPEGIYLYKALLDNTSITGKFMK